MNKYASWPGVELGSQTSPMDLALRQLFSHLG